MGSSSVLEDSLRQVEGLLVNRHAVDRGEALQAGGHIRCGTDDESFPGFVVDADANQRLASRHAAADVQRVLAEAGQARSRVADRQGGPNGPPGIVLVRDRDAEDSEHRVPDELLHHSAEVLDDRPGGVLVEAEHLRDVFGIEPFAGGGRVDHVAEQHTDDLPRLERAVGVGRDSPSAAHAEGRLSRVLLSAAGTRSGR